MRPYKNLVIVCACVLLLGGCAIDGTDSSDHYWNYFPRNQPSNQPYPEGYDSLAYHQDDPHGNNAYRAREVSVPESYHLGINNMPTASKDADRHWVDGQSPNGYTIELAEDSKPAPVASTLQGLPKTQRSAEVKSQHGSYIGIYGSYPTREAAETQLNSLPDPLKQRAKIKNWQSIQNVMGD